MINAKRKWIYLRPKIIDKEQMILHFYAMIMKLFQDIICIVIWRPRESATRPDKVYLYFHWYLEIVITSSDIRPINILQCCITILYNLNDNNYPTSKAPSIDSTCSTLSMLCNGYIILVYIDLGFVVNWNRINWYNLNK